MNAGHKIYASIVLIPIIVFLLGNIVIGGLSFLDPTYYFEGALSWIFPFKFPESFLDASELQVVAKVHAIYAFAFTPCVIYAILYLISIYCGSGYIYKFVKMSLFWLSILLPILCTLLILFEDQKYFGACGQLYKYLYNVDTSSGNGSEIILGAAFQWFMMAYYIITPFTVCFITTFCVFYYDVEYNPIGFGLEPFILFFFIVVYPYIISMLLDKIILLFVIIMISLLFMIAFAKRRVGRVKIRMNNGEEIEADVYE